MLNRAHLLLLAIAGATLLTACGDDDGFFNALPSPTEIAVTPADFLGEVSCSKNAGAMQSYVVTLSAYDDEADSTPFTVASSIASSCARTVGFREVVVVGQRYTAEIDGYELPSDALIPFGGSSSGSRQMHQVTDGAIISPRWSTRCGAIGNDATEALTNQQQFVSPCDPLLDAAPSGTAISFPPSAALGPDPCTSAPAFDIAALDGKVAKQSAVACDAPAVVFDDLEAGSYSFYVRTVDSEQATRGSECFAQAKAGQTVSPSCQALSAVGTVRLSLVALALDGAAVCPSGSFFDVALDDTVLNPLPLPCQGEAEIGPLAPGLQMLDIVVFDAEGQTSGDGARCAAEVEPGRAVTAICLP